MSQQLSPDQHEIGLEQQLPVTTRSTFPNREITASHGIVRGNSVRARNVGRDMTQVFRNIIGGELKAYSQLMTDTREEALERMVATANEQGADGVVEVRFETARIAGSAAELLAYGTAVTLR